MALLKKIEVNNSGAMVEYWKITQTNINWLRGEAQIIVEGFLSEETRRAGKFPLVAKTYNFGGVNPFPFRPDENVVSSMYGFLRTEVVTQEQEGKSTKSPGLFVDAVDLRDGEKPIDDMRNA